MIETITIDGRFNGPPNSGNGGYVCGLLARRIAGSAEVTLRKPPPLERPLTIEHAADGWLILQDGMDIVAEARQQKLELEPPPPPNFAAASAAAKGYIGFQEHYFPDCFVCGPARAQGDGLRIFAGALPGGRMVAAPWVPDGSLADEHGLVRPEFLWAALDCPGYFAVSGADLSVALLGRMTAAISQRVRPGAQNIVLGWEIGREGRKRVAGTAVYTASGILCAKAKATWIETAPAS
jgi:hypothetical protein